MYKILSGILLSITLVVISIFLLLFTNTGNAFLKPYINSYIAKNYKIDAHISSFTLKPNFLDMEVYLYKNVRVVLNGDINIWKKSFDLDFMINAKNISTKFVKLNGNTKIGGKIIGNIKHFKINGKGDIFNSLVNFDSIVDNFKAKNLHLHMNKAKIAKLLALVNKPPYVSGIADIDANFEDLNPKDLKGNAKVLIPYGSINSILIKKDFNITLPMGFIFKAKCDTTLKGKDTVSSIKFDSNLGKISSLKSIYNLNDNIFDSDYTIEIPNLALLKSIIKQNLRGNFKVTGRVKKDKNSISYLMQTFSFGGNLKAIGNNKKLKLNGQNLKVDKILYMLDKPKFSYGNIQINSQFNNIGSKNISGNVNILLNKGMLDKNIIQKDFQINIPKNLSYHSNIIANIKNGFIKFKADLDSDIANLYIRNAKVNLQNQHAKAKYDLKLDNLSKLSFITKRIIKGKADFKGDFSYLDNIFLLKGYTNLFQTHTKYSYKNGDITINSPDISIAKLVQALNYPPFFDAKGSADIFYNPKWKKGNFIIKLHNGHIVKNQFSNTVFMLSGFDITRELYKNSLLQGNIQSNIIKFVYDMKSSNTLFKIYSAVLDLNTTNIHAPFVLKIKDKDITGEIKGKLEHPKVKIKTSSYIKNKIEKVIDKKLPKKFRNPLKQIINLFGG